MVVTVFLFVLKDDDDDPAPPTVGAPGDSSSDATRVPGAPADDPSTDAPDDSGDDASQKKNYEVGYSDKTFTLTQRGAGCSESAVDLDKPQVTRDSAMNGGDLNYRFCPPNTGFGSTNHVEHFGTGATEQPSPQNCAKAAESGGVGRLAGNDIKSHQAFCVITDEEAVVWMQVVKKDKDAGAQAPAITFEATLWRPVSGS